MFMVAETDRDWVFADHDIGEMEQAGGSADVAVVVQVHRRAGKEPLRYRIPPGEGQTRQRIRSGDPGGAGLADGNQPPGAAPLPPVRFGDPEVLRSFIEGVITDPELAAHHYMLVLWGHSTGFQFGEPKDPLDVFKVAEALDSVFGPDGTRGKKLEILGCDACSMAKAESAYQLRHSVEFLVGSQIGIPLYNGWPYDAVLRRMHKRPKPAALATAIVKAFYASYDPKPVALSALNLGRANVLHACLKDLAAALLNAMADGGDEPVRVLTAFAETAHDDFEPLWDFADLCRNLGKRSKDGDVLAAARSALERLGERPSADRSRTVKTKFVASQRRRPRGRKIRGLNGFGVYVPLFTEPGDACCAQTVDRSDYNMRLVEGTRWDDLIRELHRNMKMLQGRGRPAVPPAGPLPPPSPVETVVGDADATPFSPVYLETTLRENLRQYRSTAVATM